MKLYPMPFIKFGKYFIGIDDNNRTILISKYLKDLQASIEYDSYTKKIHDFIIEKIQKIYYDYSILSKASFSEPEPYMYLIRGSSKYLNVVNFAPSVIVYNNNVIIELNKKHGKKLYIRVPYEYYEALKKPPSDNNIKKLKEQAVEYAKNIAANADFFIYGKVNIYAVKDFDELYKNVLEHSDYIKYLSRNNTINEAKGYLLYETDDELLDNKHVEYITSYDFGTNIPLNTDIIKDLPEDYGTIEPYKGIINSVGLLDYENYIMLTSLFSLLNSEDSPYIVDVKNLQHRHAIIESKKGSRVVFYITYEGSIKLSEAKKHIYEIDPYDFLELNFRYVDDTGVEPSRAAALMFIKKTMRYKQIYNIKDKILETYTELIEPYNNLKEALQIIGKSNSKEKLVYASIVYNVMMSLGILYMFPNIYRLIDRFSVTTKLLGLHIQYLLTTQHMSAFLLVAQDKKLINKLMQYIKEKILPLMNNIDFDYEGFLKLILMNMNVNIYHQLLEDPPKLTNNLESIYIKFLLDPGKLEKSLKILEQYNIALPTEIKHVLNTMISPQHIFDIMMSKFEEFRNTIIASESSKEEEEEIDYDM